MQKAARSRACEDSGSSGGARLFPTLGVGGEGVIAFVLGLNLPMPRCSVNETMSDFARMAAILQMQHRDATFFSA